jgi:hypothetical protein
MIGIAIRRRAFRSRTPASGNQRVPCSAHLEEACGLIASFARHNFISSSFQKLRQALQHLFADQTHHAERFLACQRAS